MVHPLPHSARFGPLRPPWPRSATTLDPRDLPTRCDLSLAPADRRNELEIGVHRAKRRMARNARPPGTHTETLR